jgi:hypothetical protein
MFLSLRLLPVVFFTGMSVTGFGQDKGIDFFENKVRPLLSKHCYECHSSRADKIKGGLLLDTKAGIREGGDLGPAVVPGDLGKSLLMEAVHWKNEDMQMPPKKKLPESAVKVFEQWIKMGAPDPRDGQNIIKETVNLEAGRKFWAFQSISQVKPIIKNKKWPRSKVDQFVLSGLEKKKIRPVEDAERATLIRRAFFDLTGLPPSPGEVKNFIGDNSNDAFEKVVDQLLASDRFGERWGRHWLDVARFAESNGMERNAAFPHAWRYRDYVINAFNKDKPFDQFIKEQVAGDLLSENPDDENLIATGFLAIGPKPLNNRNKAEFTMDLVDEQIDATTRAFMGFTVACARCHDHKFDPVSTEDYYSMAGIFKSTRALFGGGGNGVRQVTKLIELQEGRVPFEKLKYDYAKLVAEGQKEVKKLNKAMTQLKKEFKGKYKEAPEFKKTASSIKKLQAEVKKNRANLAKSKLQKGPLAMGLTEGNPADVKVHLRGNVETLGEIAPRGFPELFQFSNLKVNPEQSGRLELAEWIASPENPLTARVTANRVWHHLFGRGIVRTVDNFGETGDRPSNQPLLDHLAGRLIENGWSIKKLIREVMLSRTYQMSSFHNPENAKIDPDNSLFWKMNQRRLDAESMRDAILAVSGKLDLNPGKGSMLQEMKGDLGRNIKQLESLRNSENEGRSVYLPIARQAIPESLRTFDFAEPSIIVGKRDVTTVPTQALFLLNGKFVIEQSKALAERLAKIPEGKRIDKAFQILFSRPATSEEIKRSRSFVEDFIGEEQSELEAWTTICQAMLASAEFRYLN